MRWSNFGSRKPEYNSLADLPWWQVFQDPVLQGLIRTALTNNYDLQQAVARMEEARYQASAASSAFFPQINYGADAGRGRNAYYNSPANLNGVTKKFRHRQFERILGDSFLGPHPPFH
jgi:outer membrane protein TolC